MDLQHLIGSPVDGVLPEEIAPIVRDLIEGRIAQLVVIAEKVDGNILTAFPTLDEGACNRFAMLGAMEVIKRDFMREHIEPRIQYARKADQDDE